LATFPDAQRLRRKPGTAVNTFNSPVQQVVCLPTHAVVHLAGELDLHGREQLRGALAALLDQGRYRIVVDLSGLSFCDSAGLGILVAARKRAAAHGGWLRLTTPTPPVRKLFVVTGLTRLFAFYPSVAQATAELLEQGPSKAVEKSSSPG
jgi:anti-anti-sigma factor